MSAASNTVEISWLHLSDYELRTSTADPGLLAATIAHTLRDRPCDLVLFTGDAAYSGRADEFRRFEEFRRLLVEGLSEGGVQPVFVAVPGNHDQRRDPAFPEPTRPDYERDRFWSDPDDPLRAATAMSLSDWVE